MLTYCLQSARPPCTYTFQASHWTDSPVYITVEAILLPRHAATVVTTVRDHAEVLEHIQLRLRSSSGLLAQTFALEQRAAPDLCQISVVKVDDNRLYVPPMRS